MQLHVANFRDSQCLELWNTFSKDSLGGGTASNKKKLKKKKSRISSCKVAVGTWLKLKYFRYVHMKSVQSCVFKL